MEIIMDPAIAFRVHPQEGPALEVRVNFGVYAGRNATPAEIDDLAHSLREAVPVFAILAEERHEFGNDVETSLHQVVIEIDRQHAAELADDISDRIVEMANRWASACVASRSELGELGSAL
jgi:metal-dependent HD superfamily phosphatase/phosphodiesterase